MRTEHIIRFGVALGVLWATIWISCWAIGVSRQTEQGFADAVRVMRGVGVGVGSEE